MTLDEIDKALEELPSIHKDEYPEEYPHLLETARAALKVVEAAEVVAFNVAGTEGTKTNSELPEWFRLRMKDLVSALHEFHGGKFRESEK